ncbi:MAG: alpha/beta hydrolase [Clostridia bacterium]|nr:alpha/beta hydrolase [Clostridia bacterium]
MKKHKVISTALICVVVLVVSLFVISHAVYHRSFVATVIEIYMNVIDREAMYAAYAEQVPEQPVALARAIEPQALEIENEAEPVAAFAAEEPMVAEPYLKPKSVKMDIPYYDSYEHGMQVYHFNEEVSSDTLIVYYPGGGYLNQPLKYHWRIINKLSQEVNCPVLMPVYPKTPEYTCEESYEIVMKFYLDCVATKDVKKLVFMGDSSGGGMALVMAQLLRDNYPEVLQPDEIILLSPWLDISMDNEEIREVDPHDPMLDCDGVAAVGRMWAGNRDVHDPMASPIYGTFENLGRITMFASTRDILCPDAVKLSEMLNEQGIEHTFICEEGLNHPYALFPIPEAADAREVMVKAIKGEY